MCSFVKLLDSDYLFNVQLVLMRGRHSTLNTLYSTYLKYLSDGDLADFLLFIAKMVSILEVILFY